MAAPNGRTVGQPEVNPSRPAIVLIGDKSRFHSPSVCDSETLSPHPSRICYRVEDLGVRIRGLSILKSTLAAALLALAVFSSAVFASAVFASAQVSSSQIDAVFASLKSSDAPGAAVLVVRDGRVAFRQGYGVTDLRTRTKIDAHTNFRLASFTKQFTAACIMLLAHDGKLHYDDHLTDFFPSSPNMAGPSRSATCSTILPDCLTTRIC